MKDKNPVSVIAHNIIFILVAVFGMVVTCLGKNGDYPNLVTTAAILLNIRLGYHALNTQGLFEANK